MGKISLVFLQSPWLLLLIPAAVAATLIPYFRLAKRYRRTRNRIITLVMHLVVCVLSIAVLAGMQITYETPNNDNEIVILVDASYSTEDSTDSRDLFIEEIIGESSDYNCKVGLIAFGFGQERIAPLSSDVESIKRAYLDFKDGLIGADCDDSATDIADAFRSALTMINNPASSKVVLVSDGKQTDENALSVIRSLTAKGVKVDVIKPAASTKTEITSDIQINDVTFPDDYIMLNSPTTIKINLSSKTKTVANVVLYDNPVDGENNEPVKTQQVSVIEGMQEITLSHTFMGEEFHQVRVDVSLSKSVQEPLTENNSFTTFLLIEKFDKLLIVQNYADESATLESLLSGVDEDFSYLIENPFSYQITTVTIGSTEFDSARANLTQYDQIIFNNVANDDLPDGFIEEVEVYVSEYGGGLLTIGGNDQEGNVHVYDREDIGRNDDTTYQDMLPVHVVDYTPPIGVAFIIDVSGSMSGEKLEDARAGLESAVKYSLTDRDYVAIYTLDSLYGDVLPLTPRTKFNQILEAIYSIGGTGGTVATNAINRAGIALNANNEIARKHIIMLTDGQFGDPVQGNSTDLNDKPFVQAANRLYKENGITMSVVGIDMAPDSTGYNNCAAMVKASKGKVYITADTKIIGEKIREDIQDKVKVGAVSKEKFKPTIANAFDAVLNGIKLNSTGEGSNTSLDFELDAIYGGKLKSGATLVLSGDYRVPLYSYWNYGKGKVGSFMCDLKGTDGSYSKNLFASENGQRLVYGIVRELMPDTRLVSSVNADLKEENYINTLSVYDALEEGERLEAYLDKEGDPDFEKVSLTKKSDSNENGIAVTTEFSALNNFSRCVFLVKTPGVYKITLKIIAADGTERSTEFYKCFSYSKEYDAFADDESVADELLERLASSGKGSVITSSTEIDNVFTNFEPFIVNVYDPRNLFMIIATIALLIDVAVRKFKFKWPHELIREAKERKKDE